MHSIKQCFAVAILVSMGGAVDAGPVDINTADATTLAAELMGVGPALAQAIVEDRTNNGRFDSPEELARVKGIGPRVLEQNRDNILVGAPTP